jgi:hypothetical protein
MWKHFLGPIRKVSIDQAEAFMLSELRGPAQAAELVGKSRNTVDVLALKARRKLALPARRTRGIVKKSALYSEGDASRGASPGRLHSLSLTRSYLRTI